MGYPEEAISNARSSAPNVLSLALHKRVLGGVVIFLATMTPAGEIVVPGHGTGQTSFGELTGERSARCEAIQAALAAGGIASTVSENIVTELWGKFCGMAASSTIAVVTRSRAGAVAAAPAGAVFAAATFDEMRSCYDSRGISAASEHSGNCARDVEPTRLGLRPIHVA
jgi:2-dehydropantoate 2-reductase